MKMKKIYVKPETDQVNVRLFGCLLQDQNSIGFGDHSDRSEISLGKENSGIVFDDDFAGDIWSDPNAGSNAFDLWGE